MPYISYYNNHKLYGVRNRYIIWDRFSNEDYTQEKSIYSDGLIGHKRGFLSYLKYIFYLYFKLLSTHKGEDKMVIFGLQLTFFLIPYLFFSRKKYLENYSIFFLRYWGTGGYKFPQDFVNVKPQ